MANVTLALNLLVDLDEEDFGNFTEGLDALMREYVLETHTGYMATVDAFSIPEIQTVEEEE